MFTLMICDYNLRYEENSVLAFDFCGGFSGF